MATTATHEMSDTPTTRHGAHAVPVAPSRGRLRPLGLYEVRLEGGFWGRRQHVNAAATLRHVEEWLERSGWLGNFDAAVQGRLPSARRGREFSDSEVYKLLEAMAWEQARQPDDDLASRFDAIVARIAAAQEPDGYLNTMFGRPGQAPRWSNLEWGHELYCTGHLVQAAVARARGGHPDDRLVMIARRAADLVCDVFGRDGRESVPGHPEIEMALVELFRMTGDGRYLEQAALFLKRRGRHILDDSEFGRSYYQDDVPIREAAVFRGHAVRATYLAAGAVDLADATGDAELLDAITAQWQRTVARRTYITGGMGAHHRDEAFGEDFVLPPDRSYSETCAGIGSVMLAHRLLLAHGDSRFADLIERTLFNVVCTSPAHDGRAFFYANTLHERRPGTPAPLDEASPRASSAVRAPWFAVSCCPTNVARTFASLAAYIATADADGVQIHQYASASISTVLDQGRQVEIKVETAYPHDGVVRIRSHAKQPSTWTLSLRIPAWADGATLEVDGVPSTVRPGTATVTRRWQEHDELVLRLPMTPRFVHPDPRIDAVRGCVAVERGPEVLCVESIDLGEAEALDEIHVDPGIPPVMEGSRVIASGWHAPAADDSWPYGPSPSTARGTPTAIPMVPYHDWGNRGPSAMRVWIPTG